MDDNVRAQIILAAVGMTANNDTTDENDDWVLRCRENALRIAALVDPASEMSQSLRAMEEAKVISGTVIGLTKEPKSTRAIIQLRSTPHDTYRPDGIERLFTDRTDSPRGLRMARKVRGLVGHRVLAWVSLETKANSNFKVRTLCHIEDLGVATDAGTPVSVERKAVAAHDGA